MQVSKKSLRRFVALWLGIKDPKFCFHQTLTFNPKETNYSRAKQLLNRLLDNIHHRFNVASLFIAGMHSNDGIHFHVLFLFFSETSLSTVEQLKKSIWEAWNTSQNNKLARQANLFRDRTQKFKNRKDAIEYFTDEMQEFPARWWGFRNRTLISANSRPVSSTEITRFIVGSKLNANHKHGLSIIKTLHPPEESSELADSPTPVIIPEPFTQKKLRSLREWVEAYEKWEWRDFKRKKMGLDRNVSDGEFIDFLNSTKG